MMTTLGEVVNTMELDAALNSIPECVRLVQRKRRGRKLQFMMMGYSSIAEAQARINWTNVRASNVVIEFRGENTFCSLVPLN